MKVYLLSLNKDASAKNQWDFGLLKSIFDDLKYDCSQEYDHFESGYESGIVVLPARHHVGLEEHINKELIKLKKVKLFLIGDEEGSFDVDKIQHPNIDITVQNPRPDKHDKYKRLGTGYPKHFLAEIPSEPQEKTLDFFFAGQSTFHAPHLTPPMNVNIRRKLMADQLDGKSNGVLHRSEGFTQGLSHEEYYELMSKAKVAPCPSGPELPDTFRMYEALELGCIPIADEITKKDDFPEYWTWFFNEEPPFPVIRDYDNLNGWIEDCVAAYPEQNNKCQAFWYRKKWEIKEDIQDFKITVVIPVSPIKSHPKTKIIDETIESIRYHFPSCKIIVSFDGVREEQEHMSKQYNEHIRRVLYKHRDIYPVIYSEHRHQAGMMRSLLNSHITTPYVMYVEQDTPLEKEDIDFKQIFEFIKSGKSNMVRFHHESAIPKEHNHMMLNKDGIFQETVQWSQRPHIASTAFYRLAMTNFTEGAKCFIEDVMHGVVYNAYLKDKRFAYNQWKLHIYHPDGSIRRSYHTDGRSGEEKYDERQIF